MKISFKNFKSFNRPTKVDLNKFNIIIGKNSAGKTALTEAIGRYLNLRENPFRDPNYIMYSEVSRTVSMRVSQGQELNEVGYSLFDKNQDYHADRKYLFPVLSINGSQLYFDRIHFNYFVDLYQNISRSKKTKLSKSSVPNHLKPFKIINDPIPSSTTTKSFDKNISNIIEQYTECIFNEWISIPAHKRKKNKLDSSVDINYGQRDIEHIIHSKHKFIDGLSFILNKNNSEFYASHKDHSFIKNNMRDVVSSLAKIIFSSEIDRVEKNISEFQKNKKNQANSLQKNYTEVFNYFATGKFPRNIIESPYLELDYNVTGPREIKGVRHPAFVLDEFLRDMSFPAINNNEFEEDSNELIRLIQQRFTDVDGTLKAPDYSNLSDFEFTKRRKLQLGEMFSDRDLYHDFNLVPFNKTYPKYSSNKAKNRSRHRQILKSQWDHNHGFKFSIKSPLLKYQRKDQSLYSGNETANVASKHSKDEIFKFLKNVGLSEIVAKYFKKTGDNFVFNGKVAIKQIETDQDVKSDGKKNQLSYLQKSALYAANFKELIDQFSKEVENIDNSDELLDAAEIYGIPKSAVKHQINVIFYFLLMTSILQFKKVYFKYLFMDYKIRCEKIGVNIFVGENMRNLHNINVIKPQILNREQKDKIVFSFDELDKLFNNGFSYLFRNFKTQDLTDKEIDRLRSFVDDINLELRKLKLDFEIYMEHAVFKDYSTDLDDPVRMKTKDFVLIVRLKKPDITLPLNQCGMGHTIIISILASIYFAKKKNSEKIKLQESKHKKEVLIVIREPETHLHPKLIEQLLEYLFNTSNNDKHIKIAIETHSEVILRQTQYLTKKLHENTKDKENKKSNIVKVLYVDKKTKSKTPYSTVSDLGIKKNGFLSKKVPDEFFDTNTNLISKLWKKS
jgi:hypothetical protein